MAVIFSNKDCDEQGDMIHVDSVAWSSNSKMVVSGGGDSKVKLWNVTDPSKCGFMKDLGDEHDNLDFETVAWSPDSNMVASGGYKKKVKLWNVTGVDPSKWGFIKDLGEHDNYVRTVAWSMT